MTFISSKFLALDIFQSPAAIGRRSRVAYVTPVVLEQHMERQADVAQCPRYFSASSRSCSVALGDDSTATSLLIADTTHPSVSGHESSARPSTSRGRLT
jgi:hypothetical protein